ncbi:MAG: GtrA family protein [Spirochaetes bacterium]|nr:GtrA family protein [Spirochaetota bacterium]
MIYLAAKYALFAAIATAANIGMQHLCLMHYGGPFGLYAAMAAGTLVGLVIKYLLDKKYIFYHRTAGARDDLFKFAVYTCMGVLTTLVFWGTELLFNRIFTFPEAKYIGAAVGLAIGYITKYNLDRRFVFRDCKNEKA